MKEYERSFFFDLNSLIKFINKTGLKKHNEILINDYYLDKNTRLREITRDAGDVEHIFCAKYGDKVSGVREEFEDKIISDVLIQYIKQNNKLHITKKRSEIKDFPKTFRIFVDVFQHPISVACIEVEGEKFLDDSVSRNLFGNQLNSCPLSAFDYHKRRIGICGGPSSGKTETAKFLSYYINTKLHGNSFHVQEYATTFIQKQNRNPTVQDQLFIWHSQRERENSVAKKHNITISDCPTFLSYIYTQIINKKFTEHEIFYFSKMYKRVLEDIPNYTDLFLMNIINYKDNNVRYQNKDQAINIENKIRNFLVDHSVEFVSTDYNKIDEIIRKIFYFNEIE